ncbi:hypothetical protein H0P42_15090, partial [Escherichia coli]|nr:hypothetical protein [Escherichia coli]
NIRAQKADYKSDGQKSHEKNRRKTGAQGDLITPDPTSSAGGATGDLIADSRSFSPVAHRLIYRRRHHEHGSQTPCERRHG